MSLEDLEVALDEFNARQDTLKKAHDYYYGEVEEQFAAPKLRRALKRVGASFKINFARTPVEAVLNRLEIANIHVEDEQAADIIANIWDSNELDFEVNEVHRHALVYGDAYLMVWLDETDPDNPEVVITYESPRNIHIKYNNENPRRKDLAVKVWQTNEKATRANVYYDETIEKWEKKDKKNAKWNLLEEDENPFGVIPIFHFRTRRPHGRPEHKDAWGPQDMINKIVVTQMAVNDYQGFPQRYALANPDGVAGSSDFDDFDEEGADSDQIASLEGGPGGLWYMKGVNEVGQFGTADPEAFLQPLREYIKAMATTTDTPLHYFEGLQGSTSGEHIRAAEAPLNKKVKNRQLLFSKTWEDVFTFILSLFNITDVVTSIVWRPSETVDTKDNWETAQMKLNIGIPLDMVLGEMGYSPSDIDQIVGEQPVAATPQLVEEPEDGEDEVDEDSPQS